LVAGKTNLTTAFSNLETAVSNQEKKETYMSKNLTRKGLAFGAIVALGTTLFSGAAAHAAGLADNTFVSLAPTTGTEYSVLAGQSFSLQSNSATAATSATQNLKFLVADANSVVTATSTTNAYSATPTALTAVASTGVVTVTTGANKFHTGDLVTISGVASAKDSATVPADVLDTVASPTAAGALALLNASNVVITVVNDTHFTYSIGASKISANVATSTFSTGLASYIRSSRSATDSSFVFDSHNPSNSANRTVQLSADTTNGSVSVDVTAWVDSNDDNKIDSTEYASPTRTVKFLKAADITPTVILAPVSAGDTALTAYITTVPALNGDQVGNKIGAVFTRQDDTTSVAVLGGSSSWNDTTKTWTVTKSLATTDTAGNLYNTRATGTNGAWADLVAGHPAATTSTAATTTAVTVASNVATATTTATSHKLRVGDKVTFGGSANTLLTAVQFTVTSVPAANKFTFALTAADAATTLSGTNSYTVTTYATDVSVVDRAYAGTYSATAALIASADIVANTVTAAYLTKFGSAVTNGSVAKTANAVAVDVVASATVGRTSVTGASVLKANTGATVVATVTDKTGAPVAAGTPVTAVVTETAVGSPTVNGSVQSTVIASADANGQAKFVVSNASAVAGETVVLAISAEGVSGGSYTLTWAAPSYSIVGLADATSSTIRDRSAVAGGSYTFDLLVVDQFKNAAPASIRLLETLSSRTVAQLPVALTSGKASVVVSDSGLTTGDTTVAFDIQSNATGTWTSVSDATATNWSANGTNVGTVALHWAATTAKTVVALNADAATTPNGNKAAALTASTTTTALTAADLRTTATNAAYISAAGKAVVSGIAKNSVTGAGDKGAVVTATAAGVLFNVGDVWSIGSISFLADASGYFAINAYSSVPGAVKIAVVAGNSASASATVTYSGAAAADAAILKATAGATTIQAGRAVDYTVLVTDKNGLLVKGFVVKATVAGAGSFAGSAAADGSVSVTTDATGKAIVKVLYSSNDQGTATVTFADPTTGTTIASAAVSTEVGSTDANIDVVNNRVTAVASFSKGKTVSFYVDGLKKWSKTSASDADVVLNYNLKKGTHTVTVKISGGFVTTEKFIVK